MKAGLVNRVIGDIAQLFFAVENGDLVFAEDVPPFALIAIFDVLDPLDLIGRIGGAGGHKSRTQNGTGRQQNGKKFRTHHLPLYIGEFRAEGRENLPP